ncbi:hypothetical protein MSG28_012376 [Choristoneura fumiferana]|uniref:Uncharacterized protein n=1 Tax=Choristoneura fumiferana TaxID=7141 RepID=A0ACC0KCQ0_CHOFU|nr:hypothetical protein MSG28_012376 [Choristoneura fumiferana]
MSNFTYLNQSQAIKDKSMMKYANPKYLENVEVKMFRRRNSDPYKTNLTATFFHAWDTNVTIVVSYPLQGANTFNISVKGCNSIDKLWMVQLLHQNSNLTDCPVPPGTYRYFNLGPIPKVFPSPAPSVPRGSTATAKIEAFMTSTKERVLDVLLHVHPRLSATCLAVEVDCVGDNNGRRSNMASWPFLLS